MKKKIAYCILLILPFLSTPDVKAQQVVPVIKDSIPIETLLKNIEANSSYRIYTDIDNSFTIPIGTDALPPLKLLEKALEGTPYQISVYENKIFILKGKKLETYSPLLTVESEETPYKTDETLFRAESSEIATSENLVYVIGDPHAKEIPRSVILKGIVTDSKTGEAMPGVKLVIDEPYAGVTTDEDGKFTIKIPSGRRQLDISGFNIKESRRQLMLYGDGTFNIVIVEEAYELSEVTVTAGKIDNVKSIQMGVEKLQIDKIKNIPMVFGEVDLLRVIQTLPGVKTVGEASTGYNVRGGATDQNLILLNDGTIYNPNHMFGFFTAFSSEMLKEAEIYKSSIPAQYGGRISSVLDIKGKEANKEKFTGSAGIGLVTSKLNLEIPIAKEKTSLLLSGRTTYSDWILRQLPKKSGYRGGTAGFYDMGGTFSHSINTKNNLNIYGYYSHDRFSFSKQEKYSYNNLNASAKWRSVLGEKLIGSFTAGYDHYDYENSESTNASTAFKLSFDINQVFVKADFAYELDKHRLDFGFKSMLYDLSSGKYEPKGDSSLVKYDRLQKDRGLESAIYLGDEWDITSKLSVSAGIRYSIFNALGPRTYYSYNPNMLPYESTITDTLTAGGGKVFKTYHGPEFRLSARYIIANNLSVKAGFNTMRQYIHKLSNTVIMSPTDTWKLSDTNIRPQKGWQAATGVYYDTPKKDWEMSLEVYYKKMSDYLDYRGGARLMMNHHIETDVINTEGYAYGIELSVKKTAGKLNGWASYTYSRTFLRQSDKMIQNPINNGDWYPTDYDKPHDFKLTGNYKFTQRYSISVNLDYSTGRPTTIPAGKYYDYFLNNTFVYYTDRNSYRIPDYFRTDISFNIEPSHKLSLLTHSSVSIGVYNVTGRKNVYSIYYISDGKAIKGYQMSIFGTPIPFITYNIKF